MPLIKRAVSPVDVSLHRLPPNIRNNELECVSNGTLSNLVRQMSSLSKHAEDIFGELYHEAVKLEHKTNTLSSRVDRLAMKVTQLDSNVEEVSLQDLHLRKPFKSSSLIDQQSLSRGTLPTAMGEEYLQCDRPPELDKLNPYRDDDKMALKFYTDADYFFELWRKEMLKDAEVSRKVKNPKQRIPGEAPTAKKKRMRQPTDHRAKYFEKALRTGEIIDLPPEYQTPEFLRQQAAGNPNRYTGQVEAPRGMVRPGHLEGLGSGQNGQISSGYGSGSDVTDYSLPSAGQYPVGNNLHQQHPRVSMHQAHYQQQQQRYEQQHQILSNRSATAQNQRQQYHFEPGRAVTSQYMEAGYALQGGLRSDPTETPTPTGAGSPASSTDSSRRPSQPPPAPPPPPTMEYPGKQHVNGDLRNRIGRMTINEQQGSPVRASPPRPTTQPPPAPSSGTGENILSPNGLQGRSSPDLPPPPPPLTPDEYGQMTASVTSTATVEKLPSPPGSFVNSGNRGGPPPPPPPPPPDGSINGYMRTGANRQEVGGTKNDAGQEASPERRSASPSKGAGRRVMDPRSDLLRAIRDGIKLKKVDRQEEKERERAAVNEGHDVAAILKRRMEGVMGESESSEEEEWEPDEWDDD